MRYIAAAFHEVTLNRGKSLEQFLGAGHSCSELTVSWIELRPVLQGIEVWHFEVPDSGSLQFADIYEFGSDDSEPVALLGSASEALALVYSQFGASPEYWVNMSVIGDEYLDYLSAGRVADWRMAASTSIRFYCLSGGHHPIAGDVWYRVAEADGYQSERYGRYMCAALTMMVYTPSECQQVIALIDAVAAGNSMQESWGLNDTCVTFSAGGAQVEILIEDEPDMAAGLFTLKEYRKVVSGWHQFLLMPESQESSLQLVLT